MKFKILILLLSLIALTALTFSQLGQTINLQALDLFRNPHPPHPDIVILAIDNKSIQTIGRWPWDRSVHSRIINKLNEVNPAAVAVDITLSEPQNDIEDLQLSKSLQTVNYPVVLAVSKNLPLEIFLQNNLASAGRSDVPTDYDGLSRFSPEGNSLSFKLAKSLNVDLNKDKFLIDFAGSAGTFQTYPVGDFLSDQIPPVKLSKKIILIGATASDLHDTVLIPPGQLISGVEWNSNILDNLLLNRGKDIIPSWVAFVLGLLILFFYLVTFLKIPQKNLSYILIILIFVFPLASFILWQSGWVLFFLSNSISAFLLLIFNGAYHWIISELEKRKLRDSFKHYFSPAVLEEIIKNPDSLKLGGQRREVTVLFSDIRNFTTITEALPPEQLTKLLQEYFSEMTKEIYKTNGVLDKFIGDAIMAFWGAPIEQPDSADRAVKTATAMIRRLKVLQKRWLSEGLPEIDAGVGINTGVVTVGNMGSTERFDYTLIGDAVNAAARLEGLNKDYKTHIIISENTKQKLKRKYLLRSLGEVKVKGKLKTINIFEIPV